MTFQKIVAIVRDSALDRVEAALKNGGIKGISVSHVMGFGEYANFFKRDWKDRHAKIEMFVRAEDADKIVRTIVEGAHTGTPGDGIVAVAPVSRLVRIKTKTPPTAGEI